jgi:hypothetical protein
MLIVLFFFLTLDDEWPQTTKLRTDVIKEGDKTRNLLVGDIQCIEDLT